MSHIEVENSTNRHPNLLTLSLAAVALILCIAGMLYVSFTFPFVSDEYHIFVDSLWGVGSEKIGVTVKIESLYNDYFKLHYPGRGGHPNGVVFILGPCIWFLNLFKELSPANIMFFAISIRFLLIGAFLASLYLVYLFLRDIVEVNGKKIGLLAVAISAVFPPFVAYGSIRAMDTLSLLFLMLTTWSFTRLVRSATPSLIFWIIPGLAAGGFLILKKSGLMIFPVLILFSLLLSGKWEWKFIGKRLLVTIVISLAVLVVTNNPFLYFGEIFTPVSENQSLSGAPGIKKFNLLGFQIAKLWELFHPDYYHYLGYHRHASPPLYLIGLVNRYFTVSFYILYIISLLTLLVSKRWRVLLLLNLPLIILFLSLPNFAAYRFLPVFPLAFSAISAASVILWEKYPDIKVRVIVAVSVFILFSFLPIYSFFGKQVVNGEAYVDLGDVAARNRQLHFDYNMFYDRRLHQWKGDKLGVPIVLVPERDGVMKVDLNFKKTGEYWVALLLRVQAGGSSYPAGVGVELNSQRKWIQSPPDTLRWHYTGPFVLGSDNLDEDLSIVFKGVDSRMKSGRIWVYDIRIIEADILTANANTMEPPAPWWIKEAVN